MCKLLVVFIDVTNIVSGSNYPTSNLFLPDVWRMKYVMATKCGDENEYIKTMARKMNVKFLKYWGECNLLMSIVAMLDSRNKLTLIQFCSPLIYQKGDAKDQADFILDVLKDLYNEYLEKYCWVINLPDQARQAQSIGVPVHKTITQSVVGLGSQTKARPNIGLKSQVETKPK